jgi:HlyD family secretion protein
MSKPLSETRRSIRNHLLATSIAGAALVFGLGTLGAATKLSGAVMAAGSLVVQSSVKKVQHPTGGVVGELLVDEGTHVKAGQVLIRLDETVARATLSALTKDHQELQAQGARLEAERDGAETVTFPEELLRASTQPEVNRIVVGERTLFELRRSARTGQKNQLKQRIDQLRNEIGGLTEQIAAKDREIKIVSQELVGVTDLYSKNLVQLTRLNALQRDAARNQGERGSLTAMLAQTKGKIAETELQVIQVDEDMRSDVARQLGDIRAKTANVVEREVTALDQLKHLDIRSPQDGVVHELVVHSRSAVIAGGEQIMLIVPDEDKLVVEVRVSPQDIDQLSLGQTAMLRFPSFNQRTTPEMNAKVLRIAADTTQDLRSGLPYYSVHIALDGDHPLEGMKLRPGMPVDAFIQTSERTMVSYLMKPLADQMSRAFREK